MIIGIDPHKASHTAVAIGGDEQKLAEGKTKREAIWALKRRSAAPSIASSSSTHRSKGPGGQAGTTRGLRGRLCTLAAGSSAKSLPDPPNAMDSRPSMAS